MVGSITGVDDLTRKAIEYAMDAGLIKSGEIAILVHGLGDYVSSSTNVIKVIEVAKQGGYSSPKQSGIHIPFT